MNKGLDEKSVLEWVNNRINSTNNELLKSTLLLLKQEIEYGYLDKK